MESNRMKIKKLFFNNLLLLGLDKAIFEKEHGIPFNRDMFDLPNKKGYQVVTYFLFSKLSSATNEDYNLPWPLFSKELERLFQKTCYTHLTKFSQEEEVKFPRIVPSLLSTFGGDRFYGVYFALSCYVLKMRIKKNNTINCLSRPKISQENFNAARDILQLSIIQSRDNFISIETATYQNDLKWKRYAENLSECLQKLKQILESNKDLKKRKSSIISTFDFIASEENFNLEKLVEKGLLCWKSAKRQKRNLEQFFSAESNFWEYLASEVGENNENFLLNGQNFNIDVHENHPAKLSSALKTVGISCKEDGKLSVVCFIKLLIVYLKYITELFRPNMSDPHETCFVTDISMIEEELSSLHSLNKKLSEKIPDLEENIRLLKLVCYGEDPEETESSFNEICSLPILSYNPEAVKERVLSIHPDLEGKLKFPFSENKFDYEDVFSAPLLNSQNLSKATNSLVDKSDVYKHNCSSSVSSSDANVRKIALINSYKQRLSNEEENCPKASCSSKKSAMPEGLPSSHLLSSDLDDLDFSPAIHFKMRDSWLQEESLETMTLPDISFED